MLLYLITRWDKEKRRHEVVTWSHEASDAKRLLSLAKEKHRDVELFVKYEQAKNELALQKLLDVLNGDD